MPEIAEISKGLGYTLNAAAATSITDMLSPRTTANMAGIQESGNLQVKVELSSAGEILIRANSSDLPAWVFPTVKSVGQLVFGGFHTGLPSVPFKTAKYALELLPVLMTIHSPAPAVMLGNSGGIVFQWHEANTTLCVPQPAKAYFEDEGICHALVYDSADIVDAFREKIRQISLNASPWVESIVEELTALRDLRHGWDQEQAVPISPRILDAAQGLATMIGNWISVPPRVVPLADGVVQFEWRQRKSLLSLEIESQSSVHYLKFPSHEQPEEDSISIADRSRIAELLNWMESNYRDAETAVRSTKG